MKSIIVAMDGTAASGKSTAARGVARTLGWAYLNSGLLYRAWTCLLLQRGISPESSAFEEFLREPNIRPELVLEGFVFVVRLEGSLLDLELVEESVNANVSRVARHPRVRELVTAALRSAVASVNTVVEGRDIGTAVFPDAAFKFFFDADLEVRLRRRASQGIEDEIVRRDREDSERKIAPLLAAPDAIRVDTTTLDAREIVGRIVDIIRTRHHAECRATALE